MSLQAASRDDLHRTLADIQLMSRARAIKLIVSDWTGVLGDGGAHDQFSLRDSIGVGSLRKAGIRTAIVTREKSTVIARRAEVLGSSHVFLGVKDKASHLSMIADDAGLQLEAIAYIAAGVDDVELMGAVAEVGLAGAPRGAADELASVAHYRCDLSAGFGAFREFADWILRLRRGQIARN